MVERHLIGPLQSNKAREAVGLFEHLISIAAAQTWLKGWVSP